MKKHLFTLLLLINSMPLFAVEEWELHKIGFTNIAYLIGVAIAAAFATIAQSKVATSALEGISRNPSAADKIQIPMILALALIESLVIFALISVLFIK